MAQGAFKIAREQDFLVRSAALTFRSNLFVDPEKWIFMD
jgi:hypothetical protein